MEVKLRPERDLAQHCLDIAGTIMLALDARGTVTLINRKGCEILGWPEKDIVGKNWFDNFLPPGVREKVRSLFPEYLAEGGPEHYVNPVLAKNGEVRFIAWHNVTLRNASGKAVGTLSSGQDVTESRRAEQSLRESEARYRLLADNVADVIWTADLDLKFTYMSPSITRLTGYTPEEHIALSLEQVVAPGSMELILRTYREELEKGLDENPARTLTLEIEQIRKDKTTVWVEIAFSLLRGKDRKITGIMGVTRDISARKAAQAALESSEKRYKALVDNAGTGVVAIDIEGRLSFVNDAILQTTGYQKAEIIGLPFIELLHPDDSERIMGLFLGSMRRELREAELEFRVRRKDGGYIDFYTKPTISYENGEITGFYGILIDVSERKRAQKALEEQNHVLATINELSLGLSSLPATVDLRDHLIDWLLEMSGAVAATFGEYDPAGKVVVPRAIRLAKGEGADVAGLLGGPPEDLRSPVDQATYNEIIGSLVGTRRSLSEASFGAIPPELGDMIQQALGSDRVIGIAYVIEGRLFGTSLLLMKAGRPDPSFELLRAFARMAAVSLRRRVAEEEALKSRQMYRDLVENINDVVYSVDLDGNLTYISPSIERVLGYRPEEVIGRPALNVILPGDLPRAREQFTKRLGGTLEPAEYRIRDKSGREHWVRTSSRTLETGGRVEGLTGTLTDITDRKLAEEALKASERRFRLLAENSQDMLYRLRLLPRLSVEYVSPSALTITGYTPDEYYAEPVLGFGLIPFEGYPEHEGASWAREPPAGPRMMRWQRKGGGTVWLELVNHPVLNSSGQLMAVEGVARDITARKTVEDALRESEEKFRDLAEQSPNMIFINVKGRVVYANQRCEELMGYTRDEFYSPGFDFMVLAAPEYRTMVAEKYGAHLSRREVSPYEYAIVTRGGRRIEAILSTKLINYGGEPGLLGTITDITERKNAEKALRESEDKYRRLFESAPQGIVTLDLEGKVMEVNAAGLRIMNLRREEVVGRFFADIPGADSADLPGLTEQFTRFLQGETVERLEIHIRTPQGDVWQEIFPAILEKDGEPQAIQILMRDITERKLADETVRASLREKEVLLKEIHHRVKNNLQIIHSLLNMQARKDRDSRVIDALRESQNRVRTMALIHERLYRSTDLSEIDFKEYITRLSGELYSSFGANADQIRLELELQDVKLGIDSAIPCGFIVNELVSNSLKHGFPNGRRGRLRIRLESRPDGAVGLGVGDDGVGLPEGLDFKKTETLGLQLVCALVDQLRGTVELDRAFGTEFRIVFNPAKPEVD